MSDETTRSAREQHSGASLHPIQITNTVKDLRALSHVLAGSDDRELIQHAADMIEVLSRQFARSHGETNDQRVAGSGERQNADEHLHGRIKTPAKGEDVPAPTISMRPSRQPMQVADPVPLVDQLREMLPPADQEWTAEDYTIHEAIAALSNAAQPDLGCDDAEFGMSENRAARSSTAPICKQCGNSGFSGRGSGYGDVCSECGGQSAP